MMKHKPFRHIIASTVMIVLLTSCAFYTLKKYDHEYDHETDETAIQRVSDWGFDLPNDTTVANRYISKWQGWDGWFDNFYYVFKISDSYSLDKTKVIDNASHKQKWENMKDSDSLVPEINRPNFEKDMLCYIVIRWTNKSTQGVDREGKEYKNEFVEHDQDHYRHEYLDGWFYAGKGYFIIQSHGPGQTYLYSSLSIDTSEEKVIPIDN